MVGSHPDWPRRVAIAAGAAAGVMGAAVLAGWHFHSIVLIQVSPTLAPMQRVTAASFLCSGIALILIVLGYRRVGAICSLPPTVVSVLTILEYALHADFGLDKLMGPAYITVGTPYPGRMSPVTALCFLLIGLSLAMSGARKLTRHASGIMGLVGLNIAVVGVVSSLGYAVGRTDAYSWGEVTLIAVHTRAGFVLLGAGLVALAWRDSAESEVWPGWVPLAVGLAASAASLGLWQALVWHAEGTFMLLSWIMLGGGLFVSLLLAVMVHLAQTAWARSQELEESKRQFERLFESSPDAIIASDQQGRITQINEQAEKLFGYSRDELIGQPVDSLVPERFHNAHATNRQTYYSDPQRRAMGAELELFGRRKNGSEFPVDIMISPLEMTRGKFILSVVRDITERKRAEEELRLHHEITTNMGEGVVLVRRLDGAIVHANPKFESMFGYGAGEALGKHISVINAPDQRKPEETSREIMMHLERDGVWSGEVSNIKKDGTRFWTATTISTFEHQELGTVWISLHQDITERKRSEQELRESEERFRRVFEDSPTGFALTGRDYGFRKVNNALCRMTEYTEEELLQMGFEDITYPEDMEASVAWAEKLFRNEISSWRMEKRYVKKSGKVFWASLTGSVIRDEQKGTSYALAMIEDISSRKESEQKLKEQAVLLELAHDAVIMQDLNGRINFWNRGARDTYGLTSEQAVGRFIHDLLKTQFPIPLSEIHNRLLKDGQWEGELVHATGGGALITVASRWSLQRDEKGNPAYVLEINRDITVRKEAELQLKLVSERVSLATRVASIGVWDWDLRTKLTIWDDTLFAMFGIPREVPMPYEHFLRMVHPDDRADVEASLERAIRLRTQDYVEFRIIRPDGLLRYIASAEGVVMDEYGNPVRVVGISVDITERKRMAAQLETSARLSALGMMAGGVAHEINNPLTIIHASASNLLEAAGDQSAVSAEVVVRNSARIRQTADRIAKIVASMRRISREASSDQFVPAPVSRIVGDSLEICRERFRANSVELVLPAIDPDLTIPCREVQISQVLVNLLQNAFDAVSEQPGDKWVRMEVKRRADSLAFLVIDSGPGIIDELKTRIMEPFFTTKEVGKGTGLGLALSRTIAEEHGGKLEVSEVDGHTCFSLILPESNKRTQYATMGSNNPDRGR